MPQMKRARIQDIADKSGVSMMTVSRVLNRVGKVSDKTRDKVLAAAKELNYRPNVSARRLASSKSFFLGLIYDNPSASYVSEFLLGSLKRCRTLGYHLVVDQVDSDMNRTIESVKELIEVTQVDGIILLPPVSDNETILNTLIASSVPFVRISPNSNLTLSPYVCMDDYQAAFDMTESLIKSGHSQIGHIIGDPKLGSSRLRYQGYLDALRSNQISVPPDFVEQGYFTYKSGLAAAQKILAHAQKPTAIFAGNDDMAAGSISAARMLNLNVPSDLAIVGFDDTILATTVWPNISTIRQPITKMAEAAIEMMTSGKFEDLTDVNTSEFRKVLDFEIITRESSKALIS